MLKNQITRRQLSRVLAAAVAAPIASGLQKAWGQAHYPSRPVRFILPFGAAGVADITSRLAAEKLGEKLGQRFVVENQPGPGGIAAARAVLSQPPDGHTVGLVTNGNAISAAIYRALPYDPVKEFASISMIGAFDLVLATNVESELTTLGDFLQAARAQPGKLNVGTINVGSTQNLGAELFKSTAGLDFQVVPYRGSPEIIVGVLRNDVDMMVDFYAAVRSALQDGKLRGLAVSGLKRSAIVPDVPTVKEAASLDYEVTSWNGMFAPQGTPNDVIALLNRALHEILAAEDVRKQYRDVGI